MSSGQASEADEFADYHRLCSKFNLRVRFWNAKEHHCELRKREAREDAANGVADLRYLSEATDEELRAEMDRRGLR